MPRRWPTVWPRCADVLKLELAGHVGMPGWELLQRAAGEAAAQARALLCDFGPAAGAGRGRFRAAGASGYVAEVAAQLQAMQAAPGDEAQAAVASEALRLLLRMQREAAAEGGAQ